VTIRILDPYHPGQSLIHEMDARIKVLVAFALILGVNLVPISLWPVYGTLMLGILATLWLAGVPPASVLRRSAVALPFVLVAAIGVPFTSEGQVLWSARLLWWQASITDVGLLNFGTVLARSSLSVTIAIGLGATTPFVDLIRGMRALGLPAILAAIILLMYRYLFVLVDEAQRLIRARDARSAELSDRRGPSIAWRARIAGRMIGTLFLRTYERSERIYLAMVSRGFAGEIRTLSSRASDKRQDRSNASGHEPKWCPDDRNGHLESIGRGTMITVRNLEYAYPDGHVALRGIDLSVTRGERIGLIGVNGAGKSTLLLHLNGLLSGKGSIQVAGTPVDKENIRQIRREVGLVFQDPDDQLFSPTVFDDVAFGPLYMGYDEDEVRERSAWALGQVNMRDFGERMSHRLSLGEKKRISLATVLSMEPSVLALDEPSAGLDPRARQNLIDLLATLPQTMIIASHDLQFVQALCDRVIVLEEGRIVANISPDELEERMLVEGMSLRPIER